MLSTDQAPGTSHLLAVTRTPEGMRTRMRSQPKLSPRARRGVAEGTTGVTVDSVSLVDTRKGPIGDRLGNGMTPTQRTMTFRMMAVASAIAILAGCTGPGPEPAVTASPSAPTASPTPTTTPTADPAVAEAEAAVLAAYRGYWDGVVASFADPAQPQSPALAEHSDDTALTDAQSALIQLAHSGIHLVGSPTLTPKVTGLELNGAPTATIVDCVDASNWQPVFTSSGASAAAPDQPTRLTYEASAFHPEDRWLIRAVTVHRDQPC
jgi:hypothetical protein